MGEKEDLGRAMHEALQDELTDPRVDADAAQNKMIALAGPIVDYVNTVSGSVSSDLTLQHITNNGNTTDQSIIIQNADEAATYFAIGNTTSGSATFDLDAINGDFSGGDYVTIGQLNTGELRLNVGTGAGNPNPVTLFAFGGVTVGRITAGGHYQADGNMYVRYSGGDGDSYLYFYENSSPTGAHLKFDDGDDRFELNHPLFVGGTITTATSGSLFSNTRFTGTLDLVNNYITNVLDPANNQDVATKKYVDDNTGHNTSATLDDVTDNGATTDQSIIIQNASAGSTYLAVGNTSTGYAAFELDAIDGDFSGGDYVTIGQLNTGELRLNVGTGVGNPNPVILFAFGSTTVGQINPSGHYQAWGNLYANYGGGDGDSYLYFYEDSSETGAHLKFDDGDDRFELNHPLVIDTSGSSFSNTRFIEPLDLVNHKITNVTDPTLDQDVSTKKYVDDNTGHNTSATLDDVTDNGSSTDNDIGMGDLKLNVNEEDVDAIIKFYKPTPDGYETLMWDKTDGRFEFSNKVVVPTSGSIFNSLSVVNDLTVGGTITAGTCRCDSFEIDQTPVSGSISPTVYITLTVQQADGTNRTIKVAGEII